MACPTHRRGSAPPAKRRGAVDNRSIVKSRVRPAPEIYVRVEGRAYWKPKYARAHLRNKKGYVYLVWRDGERIRELYLGKAPRCSPTGSAGNQARQAPAGELLQELARRGETKVRELPAVGATPAARRFSSRP